MRSKILHIALIISLSMVAITGNAEENTKAHLDSLAVQIRGTDTLFLAYLHDVYVFPPMRFKSKKQEKFYWRTVRDVKKTLPIAKILNKEMIKTDQVMSRMSKREQRKFWKQYEKVLYDQYEDQFRQMTAAQGQMLMKLIDRESGRTSYEVIKYYKGSFVANFWQGIAKMVGNNLKEEYDGNDKDKITERIILLVEAGQL
ncbi:MAG: DUF4294 domain-containing protein [Paludibacteraceae bacterium]|nr:DUF4294 domain-containing protein [Paludibacteraceae bacterium]